MVFTSMSAEWARWQTLPSPVSILKLNNLPLFLLSSSAFDPIFFMHHANVDRLLSMWSAINPGVWVSRGVAEGGGSFTTPQGAPYDQTTGMDIWLTSIRCLMQYYLRTNAILEWSNHFLAFVYC